MKFESALVAFCGFSAKFRQGTSSFVTKFNGQTRKLIKANADSVGIHLEASFASSWKRHLVRLDSLSSNQRRFLAVVFSLLLHLGLLLLMLPSQKGFLSIGTTGLGEVNGAGTAVTLVDVIKVEQPQTSHEQAQASSNELSKPTDAQVEPEADEADAEYGPDKVETQAPEKVAVSEPPTPPLENQVPSDSTASASAGAFGQNGESYTDLWNAIAPCWNRIADNNTLPAALTISFDAGGGLSAPPVIERNPDADITDDSLHAEAKALQALSECGAYPMAKDLKNVTVQFPPPGQEAVPVQPMTPSTSLAIRP